MNGTTDLARELPDRSKPIGTLPAKTLAGFVLAVLAIIAILFLSYRTLEERATAARRMTHTLSATHDFESLLALLTDAETGQRGFLLTGSEDYLAPYQKAVGEFPQLIDSTRAEFGPADTAQAQRLNTVERLATAKFAELKQTIDMRRAGQTEAALDAVRTNQGRVTMESIRNVLAQMIQEEQKLLVVRTEQWEATTEMSALITWIGAGILLVLVGVAALMSSRDFREQAFESWHRSGQAELAARMQGSPNAERLGTTIAQFLGGFLRAQVGAIYLSKRDGELSRIGSFAEPANSSQLEAGAAAAAGLTRQAFRDNKVLRVTDVPPDYFSISSGLGSSSARQLLLAPISVDGVPVGVVELGFFRAITREEEDFLRIVGDVIGNAFRTSQYRAELEELLEETQRQSEELQTQQEELRVNNEELEQQSRALQDSQERLQNQQTELEQTNAQLEEQAQSLARQRDDLVRAQGELKRASAYKSEFLANMSHELRTPLNSSLILAKLLMDNRERNLTPEQIKFAQTIYSAGNDLLTLINDILDLSKIEAGKLDVKPENVRLSTAIDDLKNTFNPIAQERRLEFGVELGPGAPNSIFTDSTRFLQIMKNLLSNAFKFTERGGVILRVERSAEGKVSFAVRDTGIGIPAEQHEIIFEAFRQADGTTNRKHGGTGLGLSIARDLSRLLGGELALESAPGRGSTFTLILPERYAGEGAAKALSPSVSRLPFRAEPRSIDRGPLLNPGRSILVIEDDENFAQIIEALARDLDFKAIIASTAEEGLRLAERGRPSAIVLDIGLPDRSGLSVLDELKHNPATRHIPVHIISATDHSQTALEMGATGYAIKPVEKEKLIEALKRLEAKFTQKMRRVLIVEDDEVHRDSTCRLLAGDDVETVAVGTADEALEHLTHSTFDCMVLDLSLPDRTGFDLLEEMANRDQYSFPPVIVYTGRSLSRDEEQKLRRFSSSIIIKGARSPERLLDEVTLFLHQVEAKLPQDRQRMLRDARHREAIFEGRRILVVEDDVRNIFALSSVLEPKGAKIEIARNGREALEHLAANPSIDLVLMDIMMPEMDGLAATREIRKNPRFDRLPIIALTAKAMADDRESCMAAGANDYIAKPLDVDKLLSLTRVWMPK